ncbi:MAG: hypothetical protein ABS39_11320 [Acidovorax sp. SCN 65-28]|nr:MAG: hypothetical protein ABS39_11320 [Acidovorax sp. SCN 65-28]
MDNRADAYTFIDVTAQRLSEQVRDFQGWFTPVMQCNGLPVVVAYGRARCAAIGVGQIVEYLGCFIPGDEIVLTHYQLFQAPLRVLDDVGDLAKHVFVLGVGQWIEAKRFQGFFS